MGGVAPSFTVGVGGMGAGDKAPTQAQLGIGEVLAGRYEVRGRIGSGGMGEVFRAFDRTRREDVALKVMLPAFMQDEEAQERFRAEAHLTSKLSHPNIVRVYDVQEQDGKLFLSMELLRGTTVRALMEERRKLTVSQVLDIGIQLCNALAYAHRHTVHRDIKPENLWLEEDGNLKLMDFGIAKTVSATQFTMTGMSMGTAYYMSPEQLKGESNIDARTDQFAVAVVLYEMLAGQVPIGRAKPLTQVRKDVPGGTSAAIDRALSPKKVDRFKNMVEFATAAPKQSQFEDAACDRCGRGDCGTPGPGWRGVQRSGCRDVLRGRPTTRAPPRRTRSASPARRRALAAGTSPRC